MHNSIALHRHCINASGKPLLRKSIRCPPPAKSKKEMISSERERERVVPLEVAQIGPWKYSAEGQRNGEQLPPVDIQLVYGAGNTSSLFLVVRHHVMNSGVLGEEAAVSGHGTYQYHIKSVSAADLSLVKSAGRMVARLLLETDEKITRHFQPSPTCGEGDGEWDSTSDGEPERETDLDIRIVRLTTSVDKMGHLAEILTFPCEETDSEQQGGGESGHDAKPSFVLIESLPLWALYVPWKIYSRRVRLFLQYMLLLYTLLSVMWALWQLYHHVAIIQVLVQPVIIALQYYLSSMLEFLDWLFAIFTVWWHTLLSPLNVLRGLFLTPVFHLFGSIGRLFHPLYRFAPVFGRLFSALSSALHNATTHLSAVFQILSKPLSSIWGHFSKVQAVMFHILLKPLNSVARHLSKLQVLFRPLRDVWAHTDKARAVIKPGWLKWAVNLIVSGLKVIKSIFLRVRWMVRVKSVVRGLLLLLGYTLKEKRTQTPSKSRASSPSLSPVSSPSLRHRHNSTPLSCDLSTQ